MNELKINYSGNLEAWNIVSILDQDLQRDLEGAISLAAALKSGETNQERLLHLFNGMHRKWQGKAMYLIWKAHNKPPQNDYGRIAIATSMMCLLEKSKTASFIIDELIDQIHQELEQSKVHVEPVCSHTDLKFPALLESLTHLSTLEKLQKAHELIWDAEIESLDRGITPENQSTLFPRITHLSSGIYKHSREDLSCAVQKTLDIEIIRYLQDPWNYLKDLYFPGIENVSKTQIQEAAQKFFSDKQFNPLHYTVIEHPELSEWVLRGNASHISCISENRLGYLNRVHMSHILQQAAEEEQLMLGFPEIYVVDTQEHTSDLEKRFIIVEQKLPVLPKEEFIAAICALPYDKQMLLAAHLCRLIIKTGYSDVQFQNMTIKEGKLYLLGAEPKGVLWDDTDIQPSSTHTLKKNAAIGLQNIIKHLGYNLPVFRVVAEQNMAMLQEQSIDSVQHRQIFHDFVHVMHDAQASDVERLESFYRLDPQLQSFFGFMVAIASSFESNQEAGLERIRHQPQVLNHISTRTGIDILRQMDARFQLQSGIEILTSLKNALLKDTPSAKTLRHLRKELGKLLIPVEIFEPLIKRIFKVLDQLEQKNFNDPIMFKEFCFHLLHAHISGSQQCLLDDWIGMLKVIKHDYALETLKWKLVSAYHTSYGRIISNPTPARPAEDRQISAVRLEQPSPSQKLNILMVAYECSRYGLKCGGLGEAVYGMSQALALQGHHVTILTPKFNHLPSSVQKQLLPIETISHPFNQGKKQDRVLGFEDQGISLRYLEDTPENEGSVDHYALPSAHEIYEDGILKDEREPWFGLKKRMAYFSNAAAEYIVAHREDTDVAIVHDWHAAYALHQIVHRYFNLWTQGKTPTSVFIIHNNNYGCQGVYSDTAAEILPLFDDPRKGMNVMLDATQLSDHAVTVSQTFSIEIQQPILGSGIDSWMRRQSHQDKITGIVNGSNPDLWSPEDNQTLVNWIDPVTKEPVPLNFGPNDADILEKKQLIKEQLQKALEVFYPEAVSKYKLNVRDKDLLLYVGRYDSSQKGLFHFLQLLRAAHAKDAAFVTMGIGEDATATHHLDQLEEEAEKLGNAWITRGRNNASINMQRGQGDVPGLGALFRAVAIYFLAPSNFEPCGLVQFEAWLFSSLVIATATGGLKDTIDSNPDSSSFNGFTFERLANWESSEQAELIYETTLRAIDYFRQLSPQNKVKLMHQVMRNAKLSSWTSAPNGLSPIEQYERVFNAAITESKPKRGIRSIDFTGYDSPATISTDHYFGQGRQEKLYEVFGAHPIRGQDAGVNFRVMAPGATCVNVVIVDGIKEDFHAMQACGDGSWEIFVEGAAVNTVYEYEIFDKSHFATRKADPFAFRSEMRPKHASIVDDYTQFEWTDSTWMETRAISGTQEQPLNIYEIHLGSWRRNPDNSFKNYREIAIELAAYVDSLHYTHVEILGICDHPSDSSWGYQVSSYFAPNSRHGTMEDFQFFINHLHKKNIGIIIDFVPYHFAGDEWGLRAFGGEKFFEGGALYNSESPGWGTRVFDFEREDVRNFLLSSAHFFLANHIDGIRVDAVAHVTSHISKQKAWSPNKEGSHWNVDGIQFLKDLTTMVHMEFPDVIMHSENSQNIPNTKIDTDPVEMDGLGFDRRWNMAWRWDSLCFLAADSEQKKQVIHDIVLRFYKDWQMKHICTLSHDDVTQEKGSLYQRINGSHENKLAQIKMHKSLQAFFPADGMLNMMGNEFAQSSAWDYNKELDWNLLNEPGHLGVWKMTQAINALYKKHPCLWSSGVMLSRFEWLAVHTDNLVISYYRKDGKGNRLVVVHNLSMQNFMEYKFQLKDSTSMSRLKKMKIVFNSDSKDLGGSGAFDRISEAWILREAEGTAKGFTVPLRPNNTLVLQEKLHKL